MNPYLQMLMQGGPQQQQQQRPMPMPQRPMGGPQMQGQQMAGRPPPGMQHPYAQMLMGAMQGQGPQGMAGRPMGPMGQMGGGGGMINPQQLMAMRQQMAPQMMGNAPGGLPQLPRMGMPTGAPPRGY